MNLISVLLRQLDRSSPGSTETAKQVLGMLSGIPAGSVLFIGDEVSTPAMISEHFKCRPCAAFSDEFRAEQGRNAGLDSVAVQQFELPGGNYDLIWYNGTVEFDGIEQRLDYLREKLKKGGTLVYRAVSWLTEPSPDTRLFCQRRFGQILALDKELVLAKEYGWKIQDFYIAPKSDWTTGYYSQLITAAEQYAGVHKEDSSVSLGMSELRKEAGIFDAHCEEYSYVYYILKG